MTSTSRIDPLTEKDRLTGDNFAIWKVKMKLTLMAGGLWDLIGSPASSAVELKVDEKAALKLRDDRALCLIMLSLSDPQLAHVSNATSANDVWSKIQLIHEDKSNSSRTLLMGQFFKAQYMKVDANGAAVSVQEHLTKMRTMAEKLLTIGAEVPESILATGIFNSFPYEDFKNVAWSLDREGKLWTIHDISTAILLEDTRRANSVQASSASALVHQVAWTRSNQSDEKCSHCKRSGHKKEDCYSLKGFPIGHWRNPKPKQGSTGESQPAAHLAAQVALSDVPNPSTVPAFTLNAFVVLTASSGHSATIGNSDWIMDSGATAHYTNNRALYSSFNSINPRRVHMGNNAAIHAIGTGTIRCTLTVNSLSTVVSIGDVLYVPDLAMNLLSIPTMAKNGMIVECTADACLLRNQVGVVVGRAVRDIGSNLYVLKSIPMRPIEGSSNSSHVNSTQPFILAATSICSPVQDIRLWHYRFGHLNYRSIRKLPALLTGMKLSGEKQGVCEPCALGKQTRLPFTTPSNRQTTQQLELVHTDLCGPLPCISLGGSLYFATFIDEFSNFVVVKMLKSKDEAITAFTTYKSWAENQTGKKMKALRSDGGGEFTSNNFHQLLASNGIQREQTVARSPQQNGKAERMNRILLDMARCMMLAMKISPRLWAEAISTAAYLRNRSPSSTLKNATPFQVFTGKEPTFTHIRIFGSLVYYHVAAEHRTKLQAKSLPGVFVGYSPEAKAYRVFDAAKDQVVTTRDVIFDEKIPPTSNVPAVADSTGFFDKLSQIEEATDQQDAGADVNPSIDEKLNEEATAINDESDSDDVDIYPASPTESMEPRRSSRAKKFTIPFCHVNDQDVRRTYVASSLNNESSGSESDDLSEMTWEPANQIKSTVPLEPNNYAEAMSSTDSEKWLDAMALELAAIKQAGTWTLVTLPPNRQAIGSRWVLKRKLDAKGNLSRFKARLVAQGFAQKYGIDYEETFAPVAKFPSIRALLALAAQNDLEVHQMDVTSAYLNGELDEEIFMRQPPGFAAKGQEQLVCKLQKSLYGLKQAGRSWNHKIDGELKSIGFTQSTADSCIYCFNQRGALIWLSLYVDDLILVSNSLTKLTAIKQLLSQRFEMKDLGEAAFILGIEIVRNRSIRTLTINQSQYIKTLLDRFEMDRANPAATPMEPGLILTRSDGPVTITEAEEMKEIPYQSAIGGIMYAMIGTRPDISFAITALSQFSKNPGMKHWKAIKRLLRYLHGTIDFGITYSYNPSKGMLVQGYHTELLTSTGSQRPILGFSDSDWGSNIDNRRSITGYAFMIANGAVSWQSKKQQTVAQSSVEAEYMALNLAAREAVWWKRFLLDLRLDVGGPVEIMSDSQGAMALSKNPESHARTKHIAIKYHLIREYVKKQEIALDYIPTSNMIADVLTKALPRVQHQKLTIALGLRSREAVAVTRSSPKQ